MNVKKSVGYDDIICKFLKIGATSPAGILCQMVNISLNECNFPDMLKFAEIAALLKNLIDFSKKTIDQSAFSRQFRKFLSEFLEISCQLSSTRFFQNFYLALGKDIAVRPPYYGWLKIGNLNWIMVTSLEPLPLTWARLLIAYHTVCWSQNCMHMG